MEDGRHETQHTVFGREQKCIYFYPHQGKFFGHRVSFRIGINSGSIIAGVIGRRKFVYDVWGDAVNIASRMESHGLGGAVQITQTTYDLIKNEFVCEPRGSINVKGKGEMEVWLVRSAK